VGSGYAMFQILTVFPNFKHNQLHLDLAYRLHKPFYLVETPMLAKNGVGDVDQYPCGCVCSCIESVQFQIEADK
jgi:hypothetical protein